MADRLTKYTEQELKQRKVGTFIDKDFSPEKATLWKAKREIYEGEGVQKHFLSLSKSFSVLLLDAVMPNSDFYDRRTASKCAQVMMDTYLLKMARGEQCEIPTKVHLYEVKKPSEDKDGIELYDADMFEDKGGVTANEELRWIFENMRLEGVGPEDAPSIGAYSLLMHLRGNAQAMQKFYDSLWPKLLAKEDAEKTGKLEDKGKDTIDLIKRLQEALPEETE